MSPDPYYILSDEEYEQAKDIYTNYRKAYEINNDVITPDMFFDNYNEMILYDVSNSIYKLNKEIKQKITIINYLKSLKRAIC